MINLDNLDIVYSYEDNKLNLELLTNIYLEDTIIDSLNNDKHLKELIQKELLEIYRYKGEFCFSNALPF